MPNTPFNNPNWKPNAENYLEGILIRNSEIERLQKEINELADKAVGTEGYDEYRESIRSYCTN